MEINANTLQSDRDYAECGIVMRAEKIGNYSFGGMIAQGVYRYVSVFKGGGKPSVLLEFVGEAPFILEPNGDRVLDMAKLEIGDVVLKPGFVYRPREWTANLYTMHLNAMKTYRPKEIIKAGKETDLPPIDLGSIGPGAIMH